MAERFFGMVRGNTNLAKILGQSGDELTIKLFFASITLK